MSPRLRRLLTVSASIVIGATGGVLLGNFALSGLGERPALTGADELNTLSSNGIVTASASAGQRDLAPERYECQGCDASPVNEAALVDDWKPFDTTPLPPYRPDDPSPPAQVRLPVLAADRMAARPETPAAVKAVPVLAADGASGGAATPAQEAAPPAP